MRWEANQRMIKRWKQLWPYIKGVAENKCGKIALCLSLATEHTDETLEQTIFKVAEQKKSTIMIELDGLVCELQDFLLYAKIDVSNFFWTFKDWMEIDETDEDFDVDEDEDEADAEEPHEGIFAEQNEKWKMLINKLALNQYSVSMYWNTTSIPTANSESPLLVQICGDKNVVLDGMFVFVDPSNRLPPFNTSKE